MRRKDRWKEIPMVLRRKLLVNLALIAAILAVGLFMESRQSGEGFLKMTIICAAGLLIYWLLLLKTVVLGQYQVVEGTAVEVEHSGIGRKSSWEVELVNDNGERKWFCLPAREVIKGKRYRLYIWGEVVQVVERVE